jgi:putative membrane protein insertion efficiency factor
VVHRIQSTAQGSRLPFQRTSDGSQASLYQVHAAAGVITWIVVFLLGWYKRLISPLLPSACRFYPTCSEYMREAVEAHGVATGLWLGLKRLGRCHPFHAGGSDPVP